MQVPLSYDFTCTFAPLFDPPLQPVDVVDGLSAEDFDRLYRRTRRPVIINDGARTWRAFRTWTDPAHLITAAGHRHTFVRDLEASNIEAEHYHEAYREVASANWSSGCFPATPPPGT